MDKRKVYEKKIEKIIKNEKVLSILLIGAGAKVKEGEFDTLRDIDIFVITDEDYNFQREVIEVESVAFDISYMSIEAFKKGIDEELILLINSLQSYSIIYNINEDLGELLNKIEALYRKGPPKLKKDKVDYIRFKLHQDYKDILSRKEDVVNISFLMNNLFYNILISYFELNSLWIPKDKKILNYIQNTDNILYNLCRDYIREDDLNLKLKKLDGILKYVLKSHGGVKTHWEKREFPLI